MMTWLIALFLILLAFIATNERYKLLYIIIKTLPRDLKALRRFAKTNMELNKLKKKSMTVAKVFIKTAEENPKKIAYYFDEKNWTFEELEAFSNQVANYFKKNGLQRNDIVALILDNRPEYVGTWIGLSKIGVVTALINTNLSNDPLVHSITAAKAKYLIYGEQFEDNIKAVSSQISTVKLFQFSNYKNQTVWSNSVNLAEALADESTNSAELLDDIQRGTTNDSLLYVYTSGTTGLPKAAVINNSRAFLMGIGMHFMGGFTKDDIIYNPLPLYHTAGGVMGTLQPLIYATSMILKKKFSASNFWSDCVKYKATVAQYIGEICRYILAAHKPGTTYNHSVRMMFGNGLKEQIWNQFADTFKIDQIIEFYGSTEGNSNLINLESKPGAVGFLPRSVQFIYLVCLIKVDEVTEQPIRNKDGFCIRSNIGEPGILVGKIIEKMAFNNFAGYADEQATKKKILTNVFKKGDAYFNSGDLMVQDELGYIYFKDRIGDTFRWKGENVATSEVEAVITNILKLNDSVVYGVEIPGTEGRAGMVTYVDSDDSVDKTNFYQSLKNNLPIYAVPIFLRVGKSLPITGTFKLKKRELQMDGFNVHKIEDKLYVQDARNSTYIPLTNDLYDLIMNGKFRL